MQVQNFIAGIKPIQSIMRIGSAAGQLLAIPAEALRGKPETHSQSKRPAPGTVTMSRQLQRGIFGRILITACKSGFNTLVTWSCLSLREAWP